MPNHTADSSGGAAEQLHAKSSSPSNSDAHAVKRSPMNPLKWTLQITVLALVSVLLIRLAHALSGTPLGTPVPFVWLQFAFFPSYAFAFMRWKSYFDKPQHKKFTGFLRVCLWMNVVGMWASTCIYFFLSALGKVLRALLPVALPSVCSASDHSFVPSLFCLALFDVCVCITPSLLVFITLIRSEETLSIHSKRAAVLHFLYDLPAVSLVFLFKALRYPFNSLATVIPHQLQRVTGHPLSSKGAPSKSVQLTSSSPTPESEVCASFIVLGAAPLLPYEFANLRDLGVKCVINMCHELPFLNSRYRQYGMEVCYRPTLDMSAPKESDIEDAVNFIHAFVQRTHKSAEDVLRNRVFIHCKCGMGRSATITVAYLASYGGYSLNEAAQLIKDARPEVALEIKGYHSLNAFLNSFKRNAEASK